MPVETDNSPDDCRENVKKIDTFLDTLELGKKGYTVSFCRCAINTKPGVDK